MLRIALILAAGVLLALIDDTFAAAPRRPAAPSAARSDGVWHKRDGRLGYGWYSIYGDFVGTDGYTYYAPRYRSGPGGTRGWILTGPGPNSATGFRP
jgi:hypothetical protein